MIQDDKNVGSICWSALFVGAFVGVGLAFLLNLFGLAIGLSMYSSTANGAMVIAVGGFLGFLIGVIAAMGTAGFVSGYLTKSALWVPGKGVIYGFVTWSLTLALSAVLIMPLTRYVSSYKANLVHTTIYASNSDIRGVSGTNTTNMTTVNSSELAGSSWLLFALFFIGALSSAIGACLGMHCHCNKEHDEQIPLKRSKEI